MNEGKKKKDETGTFSVDAKKDPAEIDFVGPKGDKIVGIYRFDKDGKLILCTGAGREAPGRSRSTPPA